jgi:hypothetical protein
MCRFVNNQSWASKNPVQPRPNPSHPRADLTEVHERQSCSRAGGTS